MDIASDNIEKDLFPALIDGIARSLENFQERGGDVVYYIGVPDACLKACGFAPVGWHTTYAFK
jgi:hypothetical protein